MADTLLRDELIENIPELKGDEQLLEECMAICKNFNMAGVDLRFAWEARNFSRANMRDSQIRTLTMDDAKAIKSDLLAKYQKQNAAKEQQIRSEAKRANAMSAMFRRKEPVVVAAAKPVKHASTSGEAGSSRVTFKRPPEDINNRKYRYMYEKLMERSEVLDTRIDEFGEMVSNLYGVEELGDPSATSEEEVVVVGRICADVDATAPKLIEENIVLESSRISGSGRRIPLHFSPDVKLRGFPQGMTAAGLFPGAIVALKGRNGGGSAFVVTEILGLPRMTLPTNPMEHRAFKMAVACGPYTADSTMDFQIFKALLEQLGQLKPSVVLLLGPFIDTNHPSVKACDIDEEPSKIFARCIGTPLMNFLKISPDTLILLSPSVRDVLSDHPVYPQPELSSMFKDPRVKMIPNPCRFSINGVTFSSTSVDVLFHLRNQELTKMGTPVGPIPSSCPGMDTFTNACRHILYQRSIYPIFPVPLDLSSEVNLDVSHSDFLRIETGAEEHAPDVLVVPSKFKQFTKEVDGTLAVNPSFMTKHTYATIAVPDTTREDLRDAISCEIIKLQS